MKILLAIVHYWNPTGNGRHQSLRPNPGPRVKALQEQILSLKRIGSQQYQMHMGEMGIYRTNDAYRHDIDLRVITDGEHTVFDHLDPDFTACFEEVVTQPESGLFLGFEAHDYLGKIHEEAGSKYDLYGYIEDDLIFDDPIFFLKIRWFQEMFEGDNVLLPQRIEWSPRPNIVDQLFIDGPLSKNDISLLPYGFEPPVKVKVPGGDVVFETPENPHAGCFFLNSKQLSYWKKQSYWLERDSSFISPLESAATLGLMKTFKLRKPAFDFGSWLQLRHWGTSFLNLVQQ